MANNDDLEQEVEKMVTNIIEKKFYGHSRWSGWSQTIVTLITMVFLCGSAWQVISQHTKDIADGKKTDEYIVSKMEEADKEAQKEIKAHATLINDIRLGQEKYNSMASQTLLTLAEIKNDLKGTCETVQSQSKDIVLIKSKVEILTKE